MKNSVTAVTCTHCKERFQSYLERCFNASKEYSATCPQCKEQTFFMCGGAFFIDGIPDSAVKCI